jgi:hypothetical protein
MNCWPASIRIHKEEKERKKKSYEIERAHQDDVPHRRTRCGILDVDKKMLATTILRHHRSEGATSIREQQIKLN